MENEIGLLTVHQLARRLQVKPHTVRVWTRRGLIPALRVTSKVIRYDFKQVVGLISQKQLKGGSQ